eukprot:10142756-Karenia_brevis.AAC.1
MDVVLPGTELSSDSKRSDPATPPRVLPECSDAKSGPPLGAEAAAAEREVSMADSEHASLVAEREKFWAAPGVRLPHMR